jgi:DNA-binding Lrp family transcriptional regulator
MSKKKRNAEMLTVEQAAEMLGISHAAALERVEAMARRVRELRVNVTLRRFAPLPRSARINSRTQT